MQTSFVKSALLTLVIVLTAVTAWELTLRSKGYVIEYDNGAPLWSEKRAHVYEPKDKATVFIGSSRIKFDLDIPTWQNITGLHAVQLAKQGNSPRKVLEDLADDANFRGNLIVDVTEGLFFSLGSNKKVVEFLKYFRNHTPAQQAGFYLNNFLESKLVLLDKENFSLNAQLDKLEIPSRPGVFMMPIFPKNFDCNSFDRQSYMLPHFLNDTAEQNQMKSIWAFFGKMGAAAPPMADSTLTAIFQSVKTATDKIKARGGSITFVRTPSSGAYLFGENMGFPRDKYWQRLLDVTQCPGIHFADYAALNHFICPEDSHLSPTDAIIFTKGFAEALQRDKGWVFKNSLVIKQ